MNKEKIYKTAPHALASFIRKASVIFADKSKTRSRLSAALMKAKENRSQLDRVWAQLMLFFDIVRDYANGTYRDIPLSSVLSIFGAILYLLSPIDIVPDFLAVMGFFDDAFVIGLVIKKVGHELQRYEDWRINQAKQASASAISSEDLIQVQKN